MRNEPNKSKEHKRNTISENIRNTKEITRQYNTSKTDITENTKTKLTIIMNKTRRNMKATQKAHQGHETSKRYTDMRRKLKT